MQDTHNKQSINPDPKESQPAPVMPPTASRRAKYLCKLLNTYQTVQVFI